ncbi:UNVERIFIED_CONTAM: hypothetical protein PYX00_009252 [Menopon gallinae]|uniref:Luciferin 4-monooxygenase n=1 Tax=Menopon gallinae TaxID=328185 RepID=A0AAW2HAB7_9NEOP
MHLKTLVGAVLATNLRRPSRLVRILVGQVRGIAGFPDADGVISSPYGTMDFPSTMLHETFFEQISRFELRLALECSDTHRTYTFRQLRKSANALAASCQNKLKLGRGDVLAAYIPNLPEYPVLFLAASLCGAIITTVNSGYRHAEVARQIDASDAKVIFTTIALYPVVRMALNSLKRERPIVIIKDHEQQYIPEGTINYFEFTDPSSCGDLQKTSATHDDVYVLPFSSGTTGLPKGVQLMHRNMVANMLQVCHAKDKFGLKPSSYETVLGLLPMFHIYGITAITLTSLCSGATIITMPRFDPFVFLDLIAHRKVTTLYLVPPLILFLTNHPIVKSEYLRNVRLVINGASPIGESDMAKLHAKAQHLVLGQGYGMTETSPVVLIFNENTSHKRGGTGIPVVSTKVKVVDIDTQQAVKANTPGELWVKGPQVMKGYLNNPTATESTFHDGWFKTGDLCYYDEEGVFFIEDRLKDMIKVKGFQVAPAELEELLRMHPKIEDAAVIGIGNQKKGEVPKAFVVVRHGEKATEEEIKNYVKGKVAEYKQLDGGVVFVKSIPKSPSGKILKTQLKSM